MSGYLYVWSSNLKVSISLLKILNLKETCLFISSLQPFYEVGNQCCEEKYIISVTISWDAKDTCKIPDQPGQCDRVTSFLGKLNKVLQGYLLPPADQS